MSTYAENSAARERTERKAAQDNFLRRQTADFDLSAQDNHSKSERPSFIVVTASEEYRRGWEYIFGAARVREGEDTSSVSPLVLSER